MAFLDLRYFSAALQKQTAAWILYPDSGPAPFATLYLLHGLSDDHTIWLRRTALERYVAGLPLLVVMPDGGRGFYCDAREGSATATAIATELVDRIDAMFPTRRDPAGRFVAGLSMGGYGAFRLALSHPERFGAAASLSGAVAFGHSNLWHDGSPMPAEFRRVVGDDPAGGPDDLFALCDRRHADGTLPRLRFDCGVDDFLLDSNRALRKHLLAGAVPHEYEEFPGAHTWDYWDRHIQDALRFFGFTPSP